MCIRMIFFKKEIISFRHIITAKGSGIRFQGGVNSLCLTPIDLRMVKPM